MDNIIQDKRKIKSIHLAQEGIFVNSWIAREVGWWVEEIVPYHENGEMAPVIWFAIYSGGKIVRRVNGAFVESVAYAD